MDRLQTMQLTGFYENALTNQILSFWLPRCVDAAHGGFYNCFDNRGEQLRSRDKFIWSQGRFVWLFSRLSGLRAPVFSSAQRSGFLQLAAQGAEFLMAHALVSPDDWRCTYWTDETGNAKLAPGAEQLHLSIYVDLFVAAGLAQFSLQSMREDAWAFAKKLCISALERIDRGVYAALPANHSPELRAHALPMFLSCISKDLYEAAQKLEPAFAPLAKARIAACAEDVLLHFTDEQYRIRELIRADNSFFPQRLGSHINPGHSMMEVWYLLDAADICARPDWAKAACRIAQKTLETGWDAEFGGLLHYADLDGGAPLRDNTGFDEEPMSRQLDGWDGKLWFVHAEALYAALRCLLLTGQPVFQDWYDRLFSYTFRTFPNPDIEVREWIQNRERDGSPSERPVNLPVKDPYHIMRSLLLSLEALYAQMEAE